MGFHDPGAWRESERAPRAGYLARKSHAAGRPFPQLDGRRRLHRRSLLRRQGAGTRARHTSLVSRPRCSRPEDPRPFGACPVACRPERHVGDGGVGGRPVRRDASRDRLASARPLGSRAPRSRLWHSRCARRGDRLSVRRARDDVLRARPVHVSWIRRVRGALPCAARAAAPPRSGRRGRSSRWIRRRRGVPARDRCGGGRALRRARNASGSAGCGLCRWSPRGRRAASRLQHVGVRLTDNVGVHERGHPTRLQRARHRRSERVWILRRRPT